MSIAANAFNYVWNSRIAFFVLGALSMLALLSLGLSLGTAGGNVFAWVSDFSQNFSTEMIGAVLTFGLFGLADRTRLTQTYKQTLLRNARSEVNAVALQAIEELREHDWLAGRNGLLKGALLQNANLQDANLLRANLQNATLRYTNLMGSRLELAELVGANLEGANLQGANVWRANLQRAKLWHTDFQGANLENANLQDANLWHANFQGANLRRVNLHGAKLRDMLFDTYTILPDAHHINTDEDGNPIYDKYWTPDTDMSRYTHPDYRQADMHDE